MRYPNVIFVADLVAVYIDDEWNIGVEGWSRSLGRI